jgi:predicted Ser/Thr protein kinase
MPERLGHYRIKREIGRGGMGTVFEAEDERTRRTVALKVLPPELAREVSFVRRFRRETQALSVLDHPGIAKILGVGSEGGFHYYAMEYVDGSSLQALLAKEGRLDPRRAADIGVELCQALEHAHSRGIIHRDLKPANVLIDSAGHAHLTDFGIAKVVEATRMTNTGGIVGTAEFMSPEQAEGREIDRRSDLYALGALLYRMVTGRVPFEGRTVLEVIQRHRFSMIESPRELNPAVPAALSALIEQLLEKEPERRPASAAFVQRTLEGVRRLLDSGAGELADILFQRALSAPAEEEPAEPRAPYTRAAVYLAIALTLVGLALWSTRPRSAATLIARAHRCFDERVWIDAMAACREVMTRYPDSPQRPQAEKLYAEARQRRYESGKDLAALMETLAGGFARGVVGRAAIEVSDPQVSAGQIAYARAMRDLARGDRTEAQRKFHAIAVLFEKHEPKLAASAQRLAEDLAAGRHTDTKPASRRAASTEAARGD